MTDRVQQGKPENLSILLVATHLDEGDAMRPGRAPCPGAQQRRLPAARRGGDNRHLPCCRAVQAGNKIVASDQPGSAHATFTRLRPAPLIFYGRWRGHGGFHVHVAQQRSVRRLPVPSWSAQLVEWCTTVRSRLTDGWLAEYYPGGYDSSAWLAACEWRAVSRASSVRLATPSFA